MFSTGYRQFRWLAVMLALTGAVYASPSALGQGGGSPAHGEAVDPDGYLRSELDWRSYYLNRPNHQRLAPQQGREPRPSAPAADPATEVSR